MSPKPDSAKPCPSCGKPASPQHAPFCGCGCKDRDLLRWLDEGYRVPGPALEDRLDSDGDGS